MCNALAKARYFFFYTAAGRWIGMIAGGVLLFGAYLLVSRSVIYNSDNASILMEAQGMLQRNPLLQRWYMPTDSFLSDEIPLYALGLWLGFSMPALLHIVPALLYALLVLVGGYLTATLLPERQRLWGVLALLGIVAFPAPDMVQALLIGPLHFSTLLLFLLGLIAYRRYEAAAQGRWLAFALLMFITVLAVLGDPYALVLFVLPLVLAECICMLVKKRVTRRELIMLGGVLLATVLAFGLRTFLNVIGVHILLTAGFSFTNLAGVSSNVQSAATYVATIFHANIFAGSPFALSALPYYINACVLLALIYATARWLIRSFWRATPSNERFADIVCWSLVGLLAAYILSTLGGTIRYLFPLLFLSGIVSFAILAPFVKRKILLFATLLLFLMNGSLFVVSLWQAPTAVAPEAQLMATLKAHHLSHGLGGYWVAPIVTAQSEEQIVVRQVLFQGRQVHPYVFLADKQWFDASNLQSSNFIVYGDTRDGDPQMCYDAAVHSFGVPDHQYSMGIYTVLVWDTPLLTHMQAGYSF